MVDHNKDHANARISWHQDGVPHSDAFDDIYYSPEDGYAESCYVFVEQNHLVGEGCDDLPEDIPLVIGETGFGTGLNFLTLWHCLDQRAELEGRAKPVFHFQSVERFPLTIADHHKALMFWDKKTEGRAGQVADTIQDRSGSDGLFADFDQGRVRLSVHFTDAADGIQYFQDKCGYWFLDGFAPAKNPDMWTDDVFMAMAQQSLENARLSTFTAAGFVKRGLQDAGFVISKRRGFGRKRDMITGIYSPETGQQHP